LILLQMQTTLKESRTFSRSASSSELTNLSFSHPRLEASPGGPASP
jgi:hypothetical protein